jgi:hypothetical protein
MHNALAHVVYETRHCFQIAEWTAFGDDRLELLHGHHAHVHWVLTFEHHLLLVPCETREKLIKCCKHIKAGARTHTYRLSRLRT